MRLIPLVLVFITTWCLPSPLIFGATPIYDLSAGDDINVYNSWDSFFETNTLSIICVRNLLNTNETHFTKEVLCVEFQNIDKERPTRVVHTLGVYEDTHIGGCWLINRTTGLYSIKVKDGIYRTYVVDFSRDAPKTQEISSSLGSSNTTYFAATGFGDKHRMTDSRNVVIPYSKGIIYFSNNGFLVIPMEKSMYSDFTCLSGNRVFFCGKIADIPRLLLRSLDGITQNLEHITGYDANFPLPGKVSKLPRLVDGQRFVMAETALSFLFFDNTNLYMTNDKGETWVKRNVFEELGEAFPAAKPILGNRKSGPFVTLRTTEATYRGLITFAAKADMNEAVKNGNIGKQNKLCQKHVYIQEIRTKDETTYFWNFPAMEQDETLCDTSIRHAMYQLPDQSWVFIITGFDSNNRDGDYFRVIRCVGKRTSIKK
jgi:hypothetical protein